MEITMMIIWLLVSLLLAGGACLLGVRYGVSIPIAYLCALIVMSVVLVTKIVDIGQFGVPASILTYPMIFLVTDVISEIWGKKHAKLAVWIGFYASVATMFLVYVASTLPAPEFAAETAEAFNQLFAIVPRAVVGGLIAYLIAQHWDVHAFHWLKKKTEGKYLWLRNNLSTVTSQIIDSVIFMTLAFYGVFPILEMMITLIVIKIIVAAIDTPFIYGIVNWAKSIEKKTV